MFINGSPGAISRTVFISKLFEAFTSYRTRGPQAPQLQMIKNEKEIYRKLETCGLDDLLFFIWRTQNSYSDLFLESKYYRCSLCDLKTFE